jgi:flavin-dependent dehydrogenase
MTQRPVRIVGGGLAGLSLGIALRRAGVPVTIFEAGTYPRHRVCGEFLSGVSEAELERLGIAGVTARAPRHERTLWFAGDTPVRKQRLPAPAIAISRHALDAALAAGFRAAGGELRCGERVSIPAESEGWINTSGRTRQPPRWIGLKAHYRNLGLDAGLEMHLGAGGYAGLTDLGDGIVNVCALLPWRRGGGARSGALPARLANAGLRQLAARLGSAAIDEASLTAVTHFGLGWSRNRGACFSLGDSRAMIAPFTGNGMSMAIQGALLAAPLIERWSTGRMAWNEFRTEADGLFRRRFARRMLWARALQAILLTRTGQTGLRALSAAGCLPFGWLFQRLR